MWLLFLFTTFTNHFLLTDLTSPAIGHMHMFPGYKKLSSSSPAVVNGSSCLDWRDISFKLSTLKYYSWNKEQEP